MQQQQQQQQQQQRPARPEGSGLEVHRRLVRESLVTLSTFELVKALEHAKLGRDRFREEVIRDFIRDLERDFTDCDSDAGELAS